MDIVTLPLEDLAVLREVVRAYRRTLGNPRVGQSAIDSPTDQQAPSFYVAKVPAGGIAAFPAYADCYVYRLIGDDVFGTPAPKKPVYNPSSTALAAGELIFIQRDAWGKWWGLRVEASADPVSLESITIGASQNDWAVGADTDVVQLTVNADALSITGIVGGSDGRSLKVLNRGLYDVNFVHNSGASLAANRFILAENTEGIANNVMGDLVLKSGTGVELTYLEVPVPGWRAMLTGGSGQTAAGSPVLATPQYQFARWEGAKTLGPAPIPVYEPSNSRMVWGGTFFNVDSQDTNVALSGQQERNGDPVLSQIRTYTGLVCNVHSFLTTNGSGFFLLRSAGNGVTLKHNSGAGTVGARIWCPDLQDITLLGQWAILAWVSGDTHWRVIATSKPAAGGGGGGGATASFISAGATSGAAEVYYFCDTSMSGFTVTLGTGMGRIQHVKNNAGSNDVAVTPSSGLIDGAMSATLTPGQAKTYGSDGLGWRSF